MSDEKIWARYPDGVERGAQFFFTEVALPNRNSLEEMEQDAEVRRAFWRISSRDVVIDAGAGFGGYSLCALARGADMVFAFECDPRVLPVLRQNLGLDANKPTLHALEHSSTCNWRLDSDSHSIDTFIFKNLSLAPQRIDWFKIDTAGNEFEILDGARKTIERYKPNILIRAEKVSLGERERNVFKGSKMEELNGHLLVTY